MITDMSFRFVRRICGNDSLCLLFQQGNSLLTRNTAKGIIQQPNIVKGIMKKVIFLFLPFLLASPLASAEQIAIKTKDGDIVHWKDYWQDKDTGNYCTDIPRGEFCLDKSDIVQVGQD